MGGENAHESSCSKSNKIGGEQKEYNLELRDVKSVSPRAVIESCLVRAFRTAYQEAAKESNPLSMQSNKEGNSKESWLKL